MARDRTRTIFRFTLVLTSAHLIAFIVGLQWGVVGVAVAYAISTTLVEPFQSVLAARALGVSPMVFFRSVARVFQAALGMCAVVLAVRWRADRRRRRRRAAAARLHRRRRARRTCRSARGACRRSREEIRDLLRRRAGGAAVARARRAVNAPPPVRSLTSGAARSRTA